MQIEKDRPSSAHAGELVPEPVARRGPMTTSTSLPARPSFESLRKQAKKLARGIAAGEVAAIARARAQLPQAELPLSQRDA